MAADAAGDADRDRLCHAAGAVLAMPHASALATMAPTLAVREATRVYLRRSLGTAPMIAVGMVLLWGGYGVSSWGYCLIRGWNVPFRQWFSPLSPYQWPKSGDPPLIPAGQLLPGGASAPASQAPSRKAPARKGTTTLVQRPDPGPPPPAG